MPLLPEEKERYSRQILLPEFGEQGQGRLKNARVLIIGAGGLGSPAALYLAAMGVGTIGIVDYDTIALSNLHRQILYDANDVGESKTETSTERLRHSNPQIEIAPYDLRLTTENALDVLAGFDLVLDGSDNFATRYLVNDACLIHGIPLVSASILRFEGQLSVFGLDGAPCYRCVYPEAPGLGEAPSCSDAGVIGVLPGVMGTLMAMEAIKIIARIGEPLAGKMLLYNALDTSFRILQVARDPSCSICSVPKHSRKLGSDYERTCELPIEISWEEFESTSLPLVDVREEREYASIPTQGKLIPLGSLLERVGELPQEPFAIVCSMGIRSLNAVKLLRERGRNDVRSIRGGLNARIWANKEYPH